MPRVVTAGQDAALTDLLTAGLPESPDDGVFVVVPDERRGFPDVEGTARLVAGLRGAVHVVLVSSAAVNEPSHRHPGLVSEERLAAARTGNALAARWRELEEKVAAALEDAAVLTVLRPTALVAAGGRSFWSRLLDGKLAFTLPGFDPTLQLLDADDFVAAVRRVIESRQRTAGEVFNVAPSGGVPLRKALKARRILRIPVPYFLQWLARKLLAPLGAAPVEQLDYLRYSWTVSDEKLRSTLSSPPSPAPEHDPFGMDPEYIARLGRTLFRFLHDFWWRVEWRGLEHVPRRGRAVLAGVHRGHQPWDGVMTLHLLVRELGRYPRFLIHPTLVKFPHLAPYMIKCGGIHACRENAARVLEDDEILAIYPEGVRGAFTMYRDAYKLGKFGRDEFVKFALAHQAPIVPFVTVGSAEIFPIFGRIEWNWWKRYSEWPFLPITPTMSLVPLPSKWHTQYLEPLHVEERYPPEAARDRATVRAISLEDRERMQEAIDRMLSRRTSIFRGSIFGGDST